MHGIQDHAKLDIEELPHLETQVAVSGSSKQEEVGGGICLAIAIGVAVVVLG